uniref:lambda-exonuclease family protein n=1 Tax=Candidatus Phytoplasma prunorum TaxID=47565 RepID=UPI002FF29F2E
NYINASEVAAIMNLNPFESCRKILERKIFVQKQKINGAMKHGKRLEPQARFFFNQYKNKQFLPIVCVKDFMSASLDGWNDETKSLLEIKCPISFKTVTWKCFLEKEKIPMIYYAQIQAQIYCSQAKKAYFLVYQNDKNLKIKEIEKNKNFIDNMLVICQDFYNIFQQTKIFLNKIV